MIPLQSDDREQFILDNQEAFNYGALEEFGLRDDHFEENGEIISRQTIEQSMKTTKPTPEKALMWSISQQQNPHKRKGEQAQNLLTTYKSDEIE